MLDWLECLAFLDMPFNTTQPRVSRYSFEGVLHVLAPQLLKYLSEKRNTSKDSSSFAFS